MAFENVNDTAPGKEKGGVEPKIPMIEATAKECEPFMGRPETGEKLQEFLNAYFAEALKNINLYRSEKMGAAFPYTVVRLRDVAQALYEKMGSPKTVDEQASDGEEEPDAAEMEKEEASRRPKKEFIFGTMFSVGSAHAFHWTEHGIDEIAKKLPGAIDALRHGKEPDNVEIYGMGNPAGELGQVSDTFLKDMGDKPFETEGELYAEFLASISGKNEGERAPFLRLFGVSMGASMAATTAESMLKNSAATQSFEDSKSKELPYVSVNMQAPVGIEDSWNKKWWGFVPGFAVEGMLQMATSGYSRKVGGAEGTFIDIVTKAAEEKGITKSDDPEENKRKEEVIKKLLTELGKGMPIPEDLKTNEVVGIYDPLMNGEFRERVKEMNEEWRGWGIGENIVPREDENRRQFAIKETHTPKVVRENYFKRLVRAAEALEK